MEMAGRWAREGSFAWVGEYQDIYGYAKGSQGLVGGVERFHDGRYSRCEH